jgi:hypothetical protein
MPDLFFIDTKNYCKLLKNSRHKQCENVAILVISRQQQRLAEAMIDIRILFQIRPAYSAQRKRSDLAG